MVRDVREPTVASPTTRATTAAAGPSTARSTATSRLPLPSKRTALGARNDDNQRARPRAQVKGSAPGRARVARDTSAASDRIPSTSAATTAARHPTQEPKSQRSIYRPRAASPLLDSEPSASASSSKRPVRAPAGQTPRLKRADETMIGDLEPPDMPSSSAWGDSDDDTLGPLLPPALKGKGKGRSGAGGLITPEGSLELSQLSHRAQPPAASTSTRLPTPEASQNVPNTTAEETPRARRRGSVSYPPRQPTDVSLTSPSIKFTTRSPAAPPKSASSRKTRSPKEAAAPKTKSRSPKAAAQPTSRRRSMATAASKRLMAATGGSARPPRTIWHDDKVVYPSTIETGRVKEGLTPAQKKLLKGLKVGELAKPLKITPGDDPLLLRPGPRRGRTPQYKSAKEILAARRKPAEPSADNFISRRDEPQRDEDIANYGDADVTVTISDDEEAGNDTFVDKRRGKTTRGPSALAHTTTAAELEVEESAAENENENEEQGAENNDDEAPRSPVLGGLRRLVANSVSPRASPFAHNAEAGPSRPRSSPAEDFGFNDFNDFGPPSSPGFSVSPIGRTAAAASVSAASRSRSPEKNQDMRSPSPGGYMDLDIGPASDNDYGSDEEEDTAVQLKSVADEPGREEEAEDATVRREPSPKELGREEDDAHDEEEEEEQKDEVEEEQNEEEEQEEVADTRQHPPSPPNPPSPFNDVSSPAAGSPPASRPSSRSSGRSSPVATRSRTASPDKAPTSLPKSAVSPPKTARLLFPRDTTSVTPTPDVPRRKSIVPSKHKARIFDDSFVRPPAERDPTLEPADDTPAPEDAPAPVEPARCSPSPPAEVPRSPTPTQAEAQPTPTVIDESPRTQTARRGRTPATRRSIRASTTPTPRRASLAGSVGTPRSTLLCVELPSTPRSVLRNYRIIDMPDRPEKKTGGEAEDNEAKDNEQAASSVGPKARQPTLPPSSPPRPPSRAPSSHRDDGDDAPMDSYSDSDSDDEKDKEAATDAEAREEEEADKTEVEKIATDGVEENDRTPKPRRDSTPLIDLDTPAPRHTPKLPTPESPARSPTPTPPARTDGGGKIDADESDAEDGEVDLEGDTMLVDDDEDAATVRKDRHEDDVDVEDDTMLVDDEEPPIPEPEVTRIQSRASSRAPSYVSSRASSRAPSRSPALESLRVSPAARSPSASRSPSLEPIAAEELHAKDAALDASYDEAAPVEPIRASARGPSRSPVPAPSPLRTRRTVSRSPAPAPSPAPAVSPARSVRRTASPSPAPEPSLGPALSPAHSARRTASRSPVPLPIAPSSDEFDAEGDTMHVDDDDEEIAVRTPVRGLSPSHTTVPSVTPARVPISPGLRPPAAAIPISASLTSPNSRVPHQEADATMAPATNFAGGVPDPSDDSSESESDDDKIPDERESHAPRSPGPRLPDMSRHVNNRDQAAEGNVHPSSDVSEEEDVDPDASLPLRTRRSMFAGVTPVRSLLRQSQHGREDEDEREITPAPARVPVDSDHSDPVHNAPVPATPSINIVDASFETEATPRPPPGPAAHNHLSPLRPHAQGAKPLSPPQPARRQSTQSASPIRRTERTEVRSHAEKCEKYGCRSPLPHGPYRSRSPSPPTSSRSQLKYGPHRSPPPSPSVSSRAQSPSPARSPSPPPKDHVTVYLRPKPVVKLDSDEEEEAGPSLPRRRTSQERDSVERGPLRDVTLPQRSRSRSRSPLREREPSLQPSPRDVRERSEEPPARRAPRSRETSLQPRSRQSTPGLASGVEGRERSPVRDLTPVRSPEPTLVRQRTLRQPSQEPVERRQTVSREPTREPSPVRELSPARQPRPPTPAHEVTPAREPTPAAERTPTEDHTAEEIAEQATVTETVNSPQPRRSPRISSKPPSPLCPSPAPRPAFTEPAFAVPRSPLSLMHPPNSVTTAHNMHSVHFGLTDSPAMRHMKSAIDSPMKELSLHPQGYIFPNVNTPAPLPNSSSAPTPQHSSDDFDADETMEGNSADWNLSAEIVPPNTTHFADHEVSDEWDATRIESRRAMRSVERDLGSDSLGSDPVEPRSDPIEGEIEEVDAQDREQDRPAVDSESRESVDGDDNMGEGEYDEYDVALKGDNGEDEGLERSDAKDEESNDHIMLRGRIVKVEPEADAESTRESTQPPIELDPEVEANHEPEHEGEPEQPQAQQTRQVSVSPRPSVCRSRSRSRQPQTEPSDESVQKQSALPPPPPPPPPPVDKPIHRVAPSARTPLPPAPAPRLRPAPTPAPAIDNRITTPQLAQRLPSLYQGPERQRADVNGPSRNTGAGSRSLQEEISMAEDDEDLERFKSLVEVSSYDPRAAARATAVLIKHANYVEHGVNPDGTIDVIPRPRERSRSRSGHRGDVTMAFESIEASRQFTAAELLDEAEAELERTQRARSRSVSDEDLHVPGGWGPKHKRKRSDASLAPPQTTEWTRQDWKALQQVLVEQHAKFVQQLAARGAGWSPWPRRQTEWDPTVVVDAFVAQLGLQEHQLVGEWSRDAIQVRVEALEPRLRGERVRVDGETATPEPAPVPMSKRKRPRTTPAVAATPAPAPAPVPAPAPPSTIKKVMGWVLGKRAREADVEAGKEDAVTEAEEDDEFLPRHKGKGRERVEDVAPENDEQHEDEQQDGYDWGDEYGHGEDEYEDDQYDAAAEHEYEHEDELRPHRRGFLNRLDETYDAEAEPSMVQTPSRGPVTQPASLRRAAMMKRRAAPSTHSEEPRRSFGQAARYAERARVEASAQALRDLPLAPREYTRPPRNSGPRERYSYAESSTTDEYRYGSTNPASSSRLYPPLYPSLPDRSAILESAAQTSTQTYNHVASRNASSATPSRPRPPVVSGTPRPRPRVRSGDDLISPPPRPTSGGVKTLAKGYEDAAALDLSFESRRRREERERLRTLGRVREVRERVEESFSEHSVSFEQQ